MFPRIRPRAEKPMLTEDSAIAFGASRIRKQFKGTLTVPLLGVEKGFTVEIFVRKRAKPACHISLLWLSGCGDAGAVFL